MLKVSIQMVKPGQEGKLRDWMSELMNRKDEVRETFKQETVRHEQGYLIPVRGGTALIYIVEAENLEQASKAYKIPLSLSMPNTGALCRRYSAILYPPNSCMMFLLNRKCHGSD